MFIFERTYDDLALSVHRNEWNAYGGIKNAKYKLPAIYSTKDVLSTRMNENLGNTTEETSNSSTEELL